MPPESADRFIETAVRPFSDNAELQTSAVSLLETLVTSPEDEAAEAMARWDAVDEKKRRSLWKILLYVALAVVSLVMLTDLVRILLHFENQISTMGGSQFVDFFHNSPKITEEKIARNLTAEESLLVFGDLSQPTKDLRMKALWDSAPENPAYFAEYANAYLGEHKKLPPDFLRIARRIDPQNAWFTYVAAGVRAKDAVKMRPQSKADQAANLPREWDVMDATALNDSLALLREARDQPRWETYRDPLLQAQTKLLPDSTPAEVVFSLGYRAGKFSVSEISLGALGAAVAAKAWLCGEADDSAAFRELLVDAEALLGKRANSEVESFFGELRNRNGAFAIVTNASPVAAKFGFTDPSERLARALTIVNQWKAMQRDRKRDPDSDILYRHGSQLSWLAILPSSLKTLQNPPRFTLEDLRPGRLMEHETVAWTGTYLVWAMLVVTMALAAAFRFRSPLLIRRLAGRLEVLVVPRDWMMVLGAGVLLPITFFAVITRLTALGGRDLSMEYGNILFMPYFENPPLGLTQHVALALLILVVCGTIAAARFRRRTPFLKLPPAHPAGSLVAIACLAAFIPASGWSVAYESHAAAVTSWVLAGIAIAWLLVVLSKAFFGHHLTQLRYAAVSRMLVPCCALAALLCLSAAPAFKTMAFDWSAQDRMIRADENHPSGSEFEYRMALQLRKELREMLGYEP